MSSGNKVTPPRNVDVNGCVEESVSLVSPQVKFSSGVPHSSSVHPSTTSSSSHLSGTLDSPRVEQPPVGCFPATVAMVLLTSPSLIDGLSNESVDGVNLSSLNALESHEEQRRTDDRRNRSEPLASLESDQSLLNCPSLLESSSTSHESNPNSETKNKSPGKVRVKGTKDLEKDNSVRSSFSSSNNNNNNNKKKKSWFNPSSLFVIDRSWRSSSFYSGQPNSPQTNEEKEEEEEEEEISSQPFQSTYRQRNEEFKKLFKDLPSDERLIVDYSCAWQKEILIQGRMYLSLNYFCFHANFLKWETNLIVKLKDLNAVTREKTAKVIPNAIELKSNKGEKYFFASFATRDKTFACIRRLWQDSVNQQTISSTEMWKLIHESYGTDLDLTSDEEEEQRTETKRNKQQTETSPANKSNRSSLNSIRSDELSGRKEEFRDQSSLSSRDEEEEDGDDEDHPSEDEQQLLQMDEQPTSNTIIRIPPPPPPPRTSVVYLSDCPCQSHLATELIDRSYSLSVEHLFECIFGDNPFLQAYRASRRVKDFHSDPWQFDGSTGKRERLCRYKVSVAGVFGATTICSKEKQMIDCELVGSHYIIDTEVRNEGIKYADSFFVASRYCLRQISPSRSHLKVTCEVRYVKSLMLIIKSFIEKNATAALQDSYTDMMKRLEQESSSRVKSALDPSSKERSSLSTKKKFSLTSPAIEDRPTPFHQQQQTAAELNVQSIPPPLADHRPSSSWPGNQLFLLFSFVTMILLLTVNLFLYMKLNEIDRMTDRLVQSYPQWSKKSSYASEDDQWTVLLRRQEEYYQAKLGGLRSILISTYSALKNVTETLNELSQSTAGSTSSNLYSF